jgi:hypothetical protein
MWSTFVWMFRSRLFFTHHTVSWTQGGRRDAYVSSRKLVIRTVQSDWKLKRWGQISVMTLNSKLIKMGPTILYLFQSHGTKKGWTNGSNRLPRDQRNCGQHQTLLICLFPFKVSEVMLGNSQIQNFGHLLTLPSRWVIKELSVYSPLKQIFCGGRGEFITFPNLR